LSSLWVFLICDFMGAILGTLIYIYFTEFIMTKFHNLYDLDAPQIDEDFEEKQKLINSSV
jgi:hypothetical protein